MTYVKKATFQIHNMNFSLNNSIPLLIIIIEACSVVYAFHDLVAYS